MTKNRTVAAFASDLRRSLAWMVAENPEEKTVGVKGEKGNGEKGVRSQVALSLSFTFCRFSRR
jgi:hypothetical protein